ncbi:MAG: NB-ARC domain-containing protein [bacterium]|nr:NB-ARC domain-containing protein [bacterium]
MADVERKDVFISYATHDGTPYAAALRTALESAAVSVWQDVIQLPRHVGEDWWAKITEGIAHVNYVIMVITPAAFERDTVLREWRFARREGVCVLPVHASKAVDLQTVPRWMNKAQFGFLGYEPDADAIRSATGWAGFIGKIKAPCSTTRYPFMADDMTADFVQRPAHINRLIDSLLDSEYKNPRAITSELALRGAGGYGKTTLARAVCHDPRIQDAFVDGVLWVTLGENATMDTVRDNLNVLVNALTGEKVDLNLNGVKEAFKAALENREILLVIDDVWKPEHLKPFLEGGAKTARLITTRIDDVLPDDCQRVMVAGMERAEAAALIGYGLGEAEQRTHAAAITTLAGRLGEYPLLLKLANGVLRERMRLGESLAAALDYLTRALDKRGVTKALKLENTDERHRTVEATLAVSLVLLNDTDDSPELARFIRLGIFPEDVEIPLAALEKAWGCDDLDAEDLCAKLYRMSLLLAYDLAARTIRLHDVIRSYLREQRSGGMPGLWQANAEFLARYGLTHWRDLPPAEPYLWDWLAYHLEEAGQADALAATPLDLRYLAAKTSGRGTVKTEADIEAAAAFALRMGHPQADALALLARSYRNMAHLLGRCENPADALATLHARLHHLEPLQAACAAAEAALPRPRLTPWHTLPDLPHPALVRTITVPEGAVNSVAFSPDGKWIVSASDNTVRVWDAATGAAVRTLTGHEDDVNSAAFSPDEKWIVSASGDNTVRVWNAATGAEVRVLTGHTDIVNSAAFSPDGQWIVSASDDNTVRVWDAATGAAVRTLTGHTSTVNSAAFSPDGQWIVSAAWDGTVRVWEAGTGAAVRTLTGHEDVVNSAAFSPDGQWIVSASDDGTVRLWDATMGTERLTLDLDSCRVFSASFSPDSRWLVSVSEDKTLRVWDADTGAQRAIFHADAVLYSCAWSPLGDQIIAAGEGGYLYWLRWVEA